MSATHAVYFQSLASGFWNKFMQLLNHSTVAVVRLLQSSATFLYRLTLLSAVSSYLLNFGDLNFGDGWSYDGWILPVICCDPSFNEINMRSLSNFTSVTAVSHCIQYMWCEETLFSSSLCQVISWLFFGPCTTLATSFSCGFRPYQLPGQLQPLLTAQPMVFIFTNVICTGCIVVMALPSDAHASHRVSYLPGADILMMLDHWIMFTYCTSCKSNDSLGFATKTDIIILHATHPPAAHCIC